MDISVVIPTYNEEENIPLLYNRLKSTVSDLGLSHEFIFVNDGSRDRSMQQVRQLSTQDPAVKFVDFSRNFGHQIAVTAGLDHSSGDSVVIIDADLQDPPEVIADLYKKMKEGYEVVYAKRASREGESWLKKWTAKSFYRILGKLTNIKIPVDTGDFRIVDRRVVELLKEMPEQNKYLRGQIAWMGFNQTFISYDRKERYAGETGYNYRKMFRFAIDGVTAFSDIPLKIVSYFGLIVSGFAFVVMIFALYARFILKDYEPGWTSLILSVLFIGGVQMIAIGIIGEYLSRINTNIRNRPLYIVRDSNLTKTE
ncbi:MAG: glycosyltransferase family 2 protein [Saprospiraceae bacterium]|nr:glycosyltransferase family 2 protein [Saprospiraceae bacterium]